MCRLPLWNEGILKCHETKKSKAVEYSCPRGWYSKTASRLDYPKKHGVSSVFFTQNLFWDSVSCLQHAPSTQSISKSKDQMIFPPLPSPVLELSLHHAGKTQLVQPTQNKFASIWSRRQQVGGVVVQLWWYLPLIKFLPQRDTVGKGAMAGWGGVKADKNLSERSAVQQSIASRFASRAEWGWMEDRPLIWANWREVIKEP